MKRIPTILVTILVLAIIIVLALWLNKHNQTIIAPENAVEEKVPVTITETKITEANFSGTKPVIAGDSSVAVAARAYVDQSVAAFKARADAEVPGMREQFPDAIAPSTYTIEMTAKYSTGAETESIVVESYVYTGGANGNSIYKVFTAARSNDTLLALSDIIPGNSQAAFTAYIQQQLLSWRPGGMASMVVFEEDVKKLTFASFDNFSLNDNALTLYFDKYEIAPGATGAIEFSIPRGDIAQYAKEL
ncbi:MAG TPA: DUF3298 domain-containing protein [Candidatus Paceibacterota bacterium]